MSTIIISLGGSVIVPDRIDVQFLKGLRDLIEGLIKEDYCFVIYCGGGSTARKYQNALSSIIGNNHNLLDWIGIKATSINASLVRSVFHETAEERIITDPTKRILFRKRVVVAQGWKPGWSTDYDAVLVAKQLGAKKVINISNVDYVYDKDPRKYSSAKPIRKMRWKGLTQITKGKWTPGMNTPFDPVAAREAKKMKLSCFVIGKDLGNLRDVIEGRPFKGTLIS